MLKHKRNQEVWETIPFLLLSSPPPPPPSLPSTIPLSFPPSLPPLLGFLSLSLPPFLPSFFPPSVTCSFCSLWRFGFRCCANRSYRAHSCYWTRWKNNWDSELNYYVPGRYQMVGVASKHHNYFE